MADGDHDDRSCESVLISWERVIVSSHSHPLRVLHSLRTELMGSLLYPVIDKTGFLRHLSLSVYVFERFCLPMCLPVSLSLSIYLFLCANIQDFAGNVLDKDSWIIIPLSLDMQNSQDQTNSKSFLKIVALADYQNCKIERPNPQLKFFTIYSR